MTFLTKEQQELLGVQHSIEELQAALEELQFLFSVEECKKRTIKMLSKLYPPYELTLKGCGSVED